MHHHEVNETCLGNNTTDLVDYQNSWIGRKENWVPFVSTVDDENATEFVCFEFDNDDIDWIVWHNVISNIIIDVTL